MIQCSWRIKAGKGSDCGRGERYAKQSLDFHHGGV